jgi:hypothetical protein
MIEFNFFSFSNHSIYNEKKYPHFFWVFYLSCFLETSNLTTSQFSWIFSLYFPLFLGKTFRHSSLLLPRMFSLTFKHFFSQLPLFKFPSKTHQSKQCSCTAVSPSLCSGVAQIIHKPIPHSTSCTGRKDSGSSLQHSVDTPSVHNVWWMNFDP